MDVIKDLIHNLKINLTLTLIDIKYGKYIKGSTKLQTSRLFSKAPKIKNRLVLKIKQKRIVHTCIVTLRYISLFFTQDSFHMASTET